MKAPPREGVGFVLGKALEVRTRANTPLSTILASCDRLLDRADLPAETRRTVETVRRAAEEIRDLFKEMDLADSKTRAWVQKRRSRGR